MHSRTVSSSAKSLDRNDGNDNRSYDMITMGRRIKKNMVSNFCMIDKKAENELFEHMLGVATGRKMEIQINESPFK